jgi:hypothetical protein
MTADTAVRVTYRNRGTQVIHFCIPEYAQSFARMMSQKREVRSVNIEGAGRP